MEFPNMEGVPLPAFLISILHWLLVGVYLLTPIVAVGYAIRLAKKEKKPALLVSLGISAVVSTMIAVGLCLAYATMGGARMIPMQVAMGAYLAFSLILILRGFSALVGKAVKELGSAGTFLRAIVVMCVALPWVMSAVMVYRPRVSPVVTPASLARWPYENVTFPATDGSRVSGYFIPAPKRAGVVPGHWGTTTVLVVHGLGANKGNALLMARELVPAGFNVLAIDMRAHGDSAGQVATFGAEESKDVLGAVRWLKSQRPAEAERILGLGASQGAAALVTAAAQPEGEAIEALALLGTYGDLGSLMTSMTKDRFPGPLGRLLRKIAFPLAEAHAGYPLRGYRPADAIGKVWPRPVLVVHGTKDEVISVEQGRLLFNSAALPKESIWVEGSHNSILADDGVARAVLQFFRAAREVPLV